MADKLVEVLRRLEEELHRPETWRDVDRVKVLLHPEFEEIGRSGRRHTREDMLREALAGDDDRGVIRADEFTSCAIADDIALLTYKSEHVNAFGGQSRFALRSSLWIRTPAGWQMRFHQGTPAETETERLP